MRCHQSKRIVLRRNPGLTLLGELLAQFHSLDRIYGLRYTTLMIDVTGTDEFAGWFKSLKKADKDTVAIVVDMLEEAGFALGHPHSSAIQGSRYALRELRPKQGHSPLRVFYVFDPRRQAVLLIGGDKSGDKTFYRRTIPRAEAIWEQYLKEQAAGLHDKE